MELLSTWQFNVAAYIICIILYFQVNHVAIRRAQDEAAVLVLLQAIATATMLVLAPFFPLVFPRSWIFYGLVLLSSVFYAVNDRLQISVRRHLHMSVYTLLDRLVFVFLFVYGVQVFNEDFVFSKVIGILLIVGANAVLLFEKSDPGLLKYVVRAIIAAFTLATAITIDINASKLFNLPLYIAITLCIPGLFIVFFEKVTPSRLREETRRLDRRSLVLAGVMWAASMFFSIRSLQSGPVTTVVSFQSLALLVNVVLAYFLLKDRHHGRRKMAAAGVAGVGMVLLVIR